MRRRRVVKALITVAAAALLAVPAGSAASPWQIYADVADNGRLDGNYSNADLERALADAEGQASSGSGSAARASIRQRLGEQRPAGAAVRGGALPFTALDLALLTAGGVFLLAVGWGFRRLGRQGV